MLHDSNFKLALTPEIPRCKMANDYKGTQFTFGLLLLVCTISIHEAYGGIRQRRQETTCSSTPLALSANDFGASLTKSLDDTENVFISPLSIYTALAMTYLGAGGQTAQQMEDAFHLISHGLDGIQMHQLMKDLLQTIREGHDEYSLLVANGIFVDENFHVHESFTNDVQNYYHGVVENVDFVNEGEATKDAINSFVSENTHNQIEELFEGPLDSATVMVLLNAAYFKGLWQTEFPASQTVERPFHGSPANSKVMEFMRVGGQTFRYDENQELGYHVLDLPYKGGDISMLLALPIAEDLQPSLEMNAELFCHIQSRLRSVQMTEVALPKFRLEYEKNLVDALRELGIQDLFAAANLTGITSSANIAVSSVMHKAVIEVNERGSEAAAGTGVVIYNYSSQRGYTFIADHPFLVYIVDNRNGMILFSGRVSNP